MTRVLHVYSGNLYGGVETVLVTLARCRNLCPAIMEPRFALCFEGRLSAELASAGVPVHLLGRVRTSRPLTVWRARRALKALLQRERFDLVICHSAWPQAIFGPVVRSLGLPLVFWLHGEAKGQHWLERWARWVPPDLALCNSAFTAGTIPKLYPGIRNAVVYCPVAAPEASYSEGDRLAARTELDTLEEGIVIIQTSRMEAWKGHALHLKALGLLRDLPGWICWQVGGAQRRHEARYLQALKDTVARLGIAHRIRFLGQRSDVPRLLAAADIHCQPNIGPEPFGITFIEALLARLPVVTTAVGGAREIVDDTCGILVPPNDADALAGSLRRLIEDRALRMRLGTAGPARARKLCDPRAKIGQLGELLQNVASRKATETETSRLFGH